MSWKELQEASQDHAASLPIGLEQMLYRTAGEHQAIAALIIAHAWSRNTLTRTLQAQMSQCFAWVEVCVCCIKLRSILCSFVANCHLSSMQTGFWLCLAHRFW